MIQISVGGVVRQKLHVDWGWADCSAPEADLLLSKATFNSLFKGAVWNFKGWDDTEGTLIPDYFMRCLYRWPMWGTRHLSRRRWWRRCGRRFGWWATSITPTSSACWVRPARRTTTTCLWNGWQVGSGFEGISMVYFTQRSSTFWSSWRLFSCIPCQSTSWWSYDFSLSRFHSRWLCVSSVEQVRCL